MPSRSEVVERRHRRAVMLGIVVGVLVYLALVLSVVLVVWWLRG